MNLTYEFREGLAKHETDYDISTPTDFEPGARGTLESQIASFADELAYNAHDLDDGLRAGLLNVREVEETRWWQRARAAAGISADAPFDELIRHRIVRRLIGEMVTEFVAESTRRIAASGAQSVAAVRAQPGLLVGYAAESCGDESGIKGVFV